MDLQNSRGEKIMSKIVCVNVLIHLELIYFEFINYSVKYIILHKYFIDIYLH